MTSAGDDGGGDGIISIRIRSILYVFYDPYEDCARRFEHTCDVDRRK